MQSLNRVIHSAFGIFGLEVRSKRALREAYLNDLRTREIRAWKILENVDFQHIIDIGANEGQFATIARALWPSSRIDSFEPLPDVFDLLSKKLSGETNIFLHQVALGRIPGTAPMQCNEFSPSSSLLDLAPMHKAEWPQAQRCTVVHVPVERLDDWANRHELPLGPLLVKIDVQGFELEVVAGGPDLLKRADWVVLEVSFYELYKDQPLVSDVVQRFADLGFVYRGNVEQFYSKDGTRVLFADALFENTRH